MKRILFMALCSGLLALSSCTVKNATPQSSQRWSQEKANAWYASQPWLVGCNYIPANAVNQIEMWYKDTFSPDQIDKELGWAEELGFNSLRVFLNSLVYENDPDGMKERIDKFLTLCHKHGIKPMLCLYDDCWNPESEYGLQPAPQPGVHNSGWLRDPTDSARQDTLTLYPKMEKYVKDLLTTFGQDERVLLWDLWNEPGGQGYECATLPLLKKVFQFAREANPSQPLTSGIWSQSPNFAPLNAFQLENSDVITYHTYAPLNVHSNMVNSLTMLNRPLLCTEYMARTLGSLFRDIMPYLKQKKIAAYNWGFVAGKTNTIFAWGKPLHDQAEPEVWFCDIYRRDGTPFDQAEIDTIKSMTHR